MDEYDRETVLEALQDYRRWFDENDSEDKPEIERIDTAIEGAKSLLIPQDKGENIQYVIKALEELSGFDWDKKSRQFIDSSISKLNGMAEKCSG